MGRHREAAQQQLHHHSTQMGTNGPDDAAAVSGAWHTASGQRGAARTCRATASTEQTTRLEGDRQPARATHGLLGLHTAQRAHSASVQRVRKAAPHPRGRGWRLGLPPVHVQELGPGSLLPNLRWEGAPASSAPAASRGCTQQQQQQLPHHHLGQRRRRASTCRAHCRYRHRCCHCPGHCRCHNSNEAARSWARTNRTTPPPSAALRAERAGREAPDVPAGPLPAPSRRTRLEGDRQPARATHNSNEAARRWAPTDRTTRPPSAAPRAERAGRVAPDVPAGPLRAASRRTRLPGATASRPDTHNYTVRRDVRRGADGQPTAGQDDIFRVKGATQPGRSRLVADGAGSQCDGNAWTRGWWHRPTPTFDEHLASTVVGSVEGESAISRHQKSTATS